MACASMTRTVEVALIGGGIMSATLGALLATLQPNMSVALFERGPTLGGESADAWNNAGTGHAGYCELNYMPDPVDPITALEAARQFHITRQWWSHLATTGLLPDPSTFIHSTPHLDVVFGDKDVTYLRRRYATLTQFPLFAAMEYTEDPAVIAQWAPLLMAGRAGREPIAATRYQDGTDIDFGTLTRALAHIMTGAPHRTVHSGHEVTRLRRRNGLWHITGRDHTTGDRFRIQARFVFVGAGGFALRLLQRARVRAVRGYGVLPAGAAFLRCDNPDVVTRHHGKVYSQAAIGAPPMSVPHLDTRVVDGRVSLLFGPYATFSTRLLKHGRLTDVFTTLRWHNLPILAAATAQNMPFIRYLITELRATPQERFAQLQRFYPEARPEDWTLIHAGQRAQLVTPDRRRIGALRTGTELIADPATHIAGLLGASPGASTAVPIMIDLLQQCFPEHWPDWKTDLEHAIPTLTQPINTPNAVADSHTTTRQALRLDNLA